MPGPKVFQTRKQKREPIPFEIVIDVDPEVDPPEPEIVDPEWEFDPDEPMAEPTKIPNPILGSVEERPVDPDDPESEQIKVRVHGFQARGSVPGAMILDLAAAGVSPNGGFQAAAMQRFVSQVIVKKDRARWEQLLRESDPPIELEMLQEVVQYLAAQLGNSRPTK